MKNRAKCMLCGDVIESFHATDYIMCKCGEISLYGGDAMRCGAKNWDNFRRIDDEGNEIVVVVKEEREKILSENPSTIKRADLIKEVENMIRVIENLPSHAQHQPVSQWDHCCLLILLHSVLRCQD